MSAPLRKLRWRVLRGSHRVDLVEERVGVAAPVFIGLIDGREAVRAAARSDAGAALIKASCR